MGPHIKIEELLATAIGPSDDGGLRVAVTAVGDEKKGERLIVLHTAIDKTPAELRKALADEGLPNIYIPSEGSFHQVDEVPVLGTGKLDLRGIKQVAVDVFGQDS